MKKGLSLILVAAGLTSLGAGCAQESGGLSPEDFDEIKVRRQEIRGGQFDASHPWIVGVVTQQNGGFGICTGTLIAPNLVLTAQHCVAQLNSEFVQCGETRFGGVFTPSNVLVTTEAQMSQDGRDYFAGAEIHVPPGSRDVCNNDIALVILSRNIPASQAQPIVPRIDSTVFRGERYTAIGYGHTGDGGGSGTRRILEGRSVECEGSRCPSFTSVQSAEFLGTDGTCQGDSGGPALDSEGRVLGALSRGGGNCESSIYSAVAGHGDWMREIGLSAVQRGRYAAPAWIESGDTGPVALDSDGDGVDDDDDNCSSLANASQGDADGDGQGDVCDADRDGDGLDNSRDNCPEIFNANQSDGDRDGFGDPCDSRVDDATPEPEGGVIDPLPEDEDPEEGFIDEPPGAFCDEGFISEECGGGVRPNVGSPQAACAAVPAHRGQGPMPTSLALAALGLLAIARRRR